VDRTGTADRAASYLAALASRFAERRKENYELLALAEGASVLDVGCGLGEVCADLVKLVGEGGTVVGVDLSEDLLGRARQQWGMLPIRFEAGDAEALRIEDASFDAVYSERVVQHLSRPGTAIEEMARVLRPGGRLLVIDPAHSAAVVATDYPRVWEAIRACGLGQVRNPDAGLWLTEWMQTAGLEVQLHPVGLVAEDWSRFRSSALVDDGVALAVASGVITAVEAEEFMVEQQARSDRGVFAASVFGVRALGTKRP
jgi:SAM-dependent methyltransferase